MINDNPIDLANQVAAQRLKDLLDKQPSQAATAINPTSYGYGQTEPVSDGACPHCGYCRHCGRSNPVYPYIPYIGGTTTPMPGLYGTSTFSNEATDSK